MLIAVQFVLGTRVKATDHDLGKVQDLLLDDRSWALRYLVIDTHKWLPGRKVVLPPDEIAKVDWPGRVLHIDKTKEAIENSPPLAEHEPVSRQKESELADYFEWPRLWGGADPLGPDTPMGVGAEPRGSRDEEDEHALAVEPEGDSHLRSAENILDHDLEADDGGAGTVDDLIVDTEEWQIRYLVARTDEGTWFSRAQYLIDPGWINDVDWESRKIRVELTRDQIEGCPPFEPGKPINRRYEERLYDHYDRPRYWVGEEEKS